MRSRCVAAGVLAAILALTGCSEFVDVPEPAYESADGAVVQYDEDSRGDPIVFSGSSDRGEPIASADFLSSVLVVNFWYAGCAPCRLEAPWLQSIAEDYASSGVAMLGVNLLDDAATSRTFAESFGLTYPSLLDTGGAVSAGFTGYASPTAVPTTVVLDRQGRPAARIVGLIDESVLRGLIDAVLGEPTP